MRRAGHSPARFASALVCLAGLALAAGCSDEPNEETLASRSDDTREQVFATAALGIELVRSLNPELELTLSYLPDRDDAWSSCSDVPLHDTDAPTAIQWSAIRELVVAPTRETATLIDPVVAALVAQGWKSGLESAGNGGRTVNLSRQGYTVTVGGDTDPLPGAEASLGFHVYSPCIKAPANLRAWTATPQPETTP